MFRTLLWVLSVILFVWAILTVFNVLVVGGTVGTAVLFILTLLVLLGALRTGPA